jgi:Uma2 family endonuclease
LGDFMTVLSPQKLNQELPSRYHWTVEAFYRAISAGVFDEPKRIEVINGELLEKEKVNPPHATVTIRIMRHFRAAFEPEFCVREEKPIRIAFDGEPIPDVTVVSGNDEDYEAAHPRPEDVRLLVEVADSTEVFDTRNKARLYARAGITDYWVSLVRRQELWVFRNPLRNRYADPIRLHDGDSISPLFAPDVVFSVRDLIYRQPVSSPDSPNAQ